MKKVIFAVVLGLGVVGVANAEYKYLGNLSNNRFDPNSVNNPYGQYGSKYSPDSVNNPYSRYGSRFSNESVNNPYATNAPKLIQGNDGVVRIYGDDN